jgi:methylated-DNA-[protein]-cysteine S-methyltransferase
MTTTEIDEIEAALAVPSSDPTDVDAAVRGAVARAEAEGLVDVAYASVDTPIGPLLVAGTDVGLVKVGFGTHGWMLEELARQVSPRVLEAPARLDEARRELDEYFDGTRQAFDLALDWRLSRGFRRTVLEHLYAEVPFGHTVSYLELATRSGNPGASRAVGSAMATNPLPIVVPCHRVLRTGGALGGYGGGLDAKRHLLGLEGSLLV